MYESDNDLIGLGFETALGRLTTARKVSELVS